MSRIEVCYYSAPGAEKERANGLQIGLGCGLPEAIAFSWNVVSLDKNLGFSVNAKS